MSLGAQETELIVFKMKINRVIMLLAKQEGISNEDR